MKWPETRQHTVGNVTFKVELVHTDTFGNAWYGFSDPLRMPAQRALAAEVAATWADLNIAKDDLKDYLARMRQYANEGNIVDLFHLLVILEGRVDWACEDKTLLSLAKVYYLINDEPIMSPSPEHNELKDEVWNKDQEARGFFLRSAFVLTKGYSQFSVNDILNYLQVQRVVEAKAEQAPARSIGSEASMKSSKPASPTSTSKHGSLRVKPQPRRKR